jgi:hypothetical protein
LNTFLKDHVLPAKNKLKTKKYQSEYAIYQSKYAIYRCIYISDANRKWIYSIKYSTLITLKTLLSWMKSQY